MKIIILSLFFFISSLSLAENHTVPKSTSCPYGGIRLIDGGECCKNNYALNEEKNRYDRVNVVYCGCPKGHEKECAKQKEKVKEFEEIISNIVE